MGVWQVDWGSLNIYKGNGRLLRKEPPSFYGRFTTYFLPTSRGCGQQFQSPWRNASPLWKFTNEQRALNEVFAICFFFITPNIVVLFLQTKLSIVDAHFTFFFIPRRGGVRNAFVLTGSRILSFAVFFFCEIFHRLLFICFCVVWARFFFVCVLGG